MKKLLLASAILFVGAGIAAAQSDLPAAAKDDMPGVTGGGTTADPNAKPKASDLPAGAQEKMPAADK